jgi:hypothetical protein
MKKTSIEPRPISQHEKAASFVRDYLRSHGEWPSIKAIVYGASVGTGTAWRAMKAVHRSFLDGSK